MSPIDLTTVLKGAPIVEWIAPSHDQQRIVATAKALDKAVQAAQLQGEECPHCFEGTVLAHSCSEFHDPLMEFK